MNYLKNKSGKTKVLALIFLGLTILSCKDAQKETTTVGVFPTEQTTSDVVIDNQVLSDYMTLKEALVETEEKTAATAAETLENSLNNYDLTAFNENKQSELQTLVADAKSHAQNIANGDIEKQREEFEFLSANVRDMIEITGAGTKVYQQFCPMYGEDGGIWLSTEENIRNPYFGEEMMTCGEIQKEFD
ncbi:DUF3347 domain-containing protein [Flavobacteriaceae bacterium Ap0902]|nr:DUF3347 domain-containing protein [Flavobacteriaceae bacterium Ap0902]